MKTTKSLLTLTVSREELLAALVENIDDPGVKRALNPVEINPEVERGLKGTIGNVSVNGEVGILGHDEVCVYLGGVVRIKAEAIDYMRAVSGCITAVGGRAINVYRFSAGEPANVTRYLVDVKGMALSMQGGPAH